MNNGFSAECALENRAYRILGSQGTVSRKSRKRFGSDKPLVKLRPADSVKLVFSYVVKGMEIEITAKFGASRPLRFEDTKRIMSPEMCPKRFGTFEKRAPGDEMNQNFFERKSKCRAESRKLEMNVVRLFQLYLES